MTDRPEERDIRVAESDLSDLEVGTPEVTEETAVPDAFLPGGDDGSSGETTDVVEDQAEEILDEELEQLPGFPGTP
jgi:hypothetical protein